MNFRQHRVATSLRSAARLCIRLVQPAPPIRSADEHDWYQQYESLAPARFVAWLANEVAIDIASQRQSHTNLEMLLAAIDRNATGLMQSDAERFLLVEVGSSYFCDHQRILAVFRRLLNHKLRWSKYLA